MRVTDNIYGTDIIYNYGTFDFADPDFYPKFVEGNLLYFVSTEKFTDFIYSYQLENRSIIEQQLQLTCEEKQQLFKALQINSLEQNKYYHYKFLLDNCSTRLRDIVANNTKDSLTFRSILPSPPPSFRDMLHEYLDKGKQYWSGFGIDLVLGTEADRGANNSEAMFLPDYLMKGFDSGFINNKPIVSNKRTILPASSVIQQEDSFFTPLNTTVLLLLIIGTLSFIKLKPIQNILNIFDVAFFLILGAIGALILFMWVGTQHELCRNNYNLLWALPTHLPMAFFILTKKDWVKQYFKISAIIYLILVILWVFLPQGMNSAFFPLVALAGIRSFFRAFKK